MIRSLAALSVLMFLAACSAPAKVEFRAATKHAVPGAIELPDPGTSTMVYVEPFVVITNADITSASMTTMDDGSRAVTIALTEAGATKLGNYTSAHVDQPIAIMVDDELYAAPVILSTLTTGALITRGPSGLSQAEADRLVRSLSR